MRPVNLIPPEERRGERAPMRTGPLAYVVVAVLAVALVAVTVDRADRQPDLRPQGREVASLEAQVGRRAGRGRAPELVRRVRLAASRPASRPCPSLAQSRFDWERVLRELAIVIPTTSG